MSDSRIGVRYAKALFSLANDKDQLESVRKDMQLLLSLDTGVPEFRQLMSTPLVRPSKKTEILHALLKNELAAITLDFLHLLINHGRSTALADSCRMFNRLYKQQKGIVEAQLSSVIELNEKLLKQLNEWLAHELNASVEMTHSTNDELIGGFVLKLDDQQMDASVSTYLQRIKNELRQVLN